METFTNEPRVVASDDATPIIQLATAPRPIPPSPPRTFDFNKLILPGAIILAAVMISGSVLYSRLSNGTALIKDPGNAGPVEVTIGDSPVWGDQKAAVTVVEFGDYQCPFCKRYFDNVQSAIINQYVNTGKVKFVWKDFAFLGPESTWAAESARCAKDQGKFWEYHNYLYSHQGGENVGAFSKDNLKKFAAAVGLNITSFNNCLDSDKYAQQVQEETQYGSTVGVKGTPATFVNGVLISGAVPFSQIQAAIEAALKD